MPAPDTWSVSQLVGWVNALIGETLGGEIWVEGEISNLQRSSIGHVYFTLSEPADEATGTPNTVAVTLFEWHRQNVNRHLKRSGGAVRMSEGVRVRIRGSLEIYGPRSQLQLKMSGIDPVFTLGNMAAERARLLESLRADGLLGANARLVLDPLPLRIGLVTSAGSAAHADALHELSAGGIGFDVSVFDTRVQGAEAVASIVAALARAGSSGVDVIALVRGGGARTDLAAFDDELVARAIAMSPVPVWTGLGHEIDRTVADEVAHRSWKTPTACAAAIVETVRSGADRVDDRWAAVCDATERRLQAGTARLDRLGSRVARTAVADLDIAAVRVTAAANRTGRLAEAHLIRQDARLVAATRGLGATPRLIAICEQRLDAVAATVRAYDPTAALARGWSITRTADGRLARVTDLAPGDEIVTTLAGGTVGSTVAAVEPRPTTSDGSAAGTTVAPT